MRAEELKPGQFLHPYYSHKGSPQEVVSVSDDSIGIKENGGVVDALRVVVKSAHGAGTELIRLPKAATVKVSEGPAEAVHAFFKPWGS